MAANIRIGLDLDKSRFDAKMREAFKDTQIFSRNGVEAVLKAKIDYSDFTDKSKLKRAFTRLKKDFDEEWRGLIAAGFKKKSGKAYDFGNFANVENEYFRLLPKQKKGTLSDSREIEMFDRLTAVMQKAADVGTEYNRVAERRQKLNRASDNAVKEAALRRETRELTSVDAAMRKVVATQKELARERTKHARGGGQWLSSIYRQINLYHDLEAAARQAGNAKYADFIRDKRLPALNQQADAIERVNRLFGKQGRIVNGLRSVLYRYFSVYMVADFAKKVADTTGYFQQQRVALEGILGSASKAVSVLNEIKSFALQSPFQTKDLVTFTKQLAAFGVNNNDLFPTVKKLSDISAGLGVDMGRIILAYGQVKSAAVLRGQELRQFTEAGIPMVQALADKFTALNGKLVTTGEVFKLISERKVPFEMVASVLSDMTAEGGKFYKMQENITNTTYGQIQKLKDLWTLALDDIGKSASGFINTIIKGIQNIVKNVQPIAIAIASLVAGRGLGKAVSMVIRLARAFKSAAVASRLLAGGLITSIGGALGVVGGLIGGFIFNAVRKSGELDRKMNEVADSYAKDTQKMCDGLDTLSRKITSANVGTKKFSDAVSTLVANYGQFVSPDIINALQSQGTAAEKAADGFTKLAESIKEAIRQQNDYNAQVAQANTAAETAGTESYENMTKGFKFGGAFDILSVGFADAKRGAGSQAGLRDYEGISEFLNAKKLTRDAFLSSLTTMMQDAIINAAKEGIPLDNDNELKERFAKRILNTWRDFDSDTANKIASNIYLAIDKKSYNKAVEKLAVANTTTYANIDAPFKAAVEKVGRGEYKKVRGRIIDDNISKEQDTGEIWRDALKQSLKNAKLTDYVGSNLETIVNDSSKSAYDIQQAFKEFSNRKTPEELAYLNQILKNYTDNVSVRSGHSLRVSDAFKREGTELYRWRQDEKLKNIVYTYGSPTDANFEALRYQLQSQIAETEKKIAEYKNAPGGPGQFAKDLADKEKELRALKILSGGKYYGIGNKKTGGGVSSSRGWRRFMSDLFSWVKEGKEEEKKLVEFSAGLTDQLSEQIESGQMTGTAIRAFWDNTPFKKFIDKMDEYGIESDVLSKDFLRNGLTKMTVQQLKATGTIDWQDVWEQLIKIINARADELSKNPKMKSTVDMLKTFSADRAIEGQKIFSRDNVEKLIEDQLKEMRKINGQFDKLRSEQKAIDRIRESSNALRAYQTLGSRGYTSNAEVTRQQLQSLLSSVGGKGLSLATPLAQLINGGKLGIAGIGQILAVKQSLSGISTKDMNGDDDAARQANFKEFQGVLNQFDQLLGQLVNDIEEDFKRLMALKDPTMKASDDIINAFDEFRKALELIANGIENGDISKTESEAMSVQDLQNLFGSISKGLGGNGMQDFINRLYKQEGTDIGVSSTGFGVGMWLNKGSLAEKYANMQAQMVASRKQDLDYELENGYITQKEYDAELEKATKEAADATIDFASKMELTSAIIQKVDSYIQKSAQFANKLIDAMDANNGLTTDEYGNYTYENDYSEAKKAVNMIAEFSSGISGSFQSFMQGDIFGGIMGIGTSIAGFFENLFGIGDAKIQRQQDKLISSNESLERSLNNLEHAINGVAGIDKWKNYTEQIEKLKQQEANNKKLEELEVGKKHGDKDKAESYRDASEEARRQIEDIIRGIQEEIFGTADELASQLTDALVEAFRNGENAARAWRDAVRSYIGDVLKEVLMTKVIAPQIKNLLDEFLDGATDPKEILKRFSDPDAATGLRNDIILLVNEMIEGFESFPKPIQEMIAWNSDTSELSGGIQGITEDTARTLEGLSNSMLAQLVLIQRSVLAIENSGFANVQTSWFNDMLNQQRAMRLAVDSIEGILTGARDGVRSIKVRME